jgi:hypothetical protein
MLRKTTSGCTALSIDWKSDRLKKTNGQNKQVNVNTNIPDVRIVFLVIKKIFPKRI